MLKSRVLQSNSFTQALRDFQWEMQGTAMMLRFALFSLFLSVSVLFYLYAILWSRPNKLREKLRSQGINGPEPSLLFGNIPDMKRIQFETKSAKKEDDQRGNSQFSSDYVSNLFPYFVQWRKIYGPLYMYSTGGRQILNVSDPDLVKEIHNCKSLEFGKPSYLQKDLNALLGKGIVTSNGDLWAHQRKIIAPQFFIEKIKGMVELMVDTTGPLINAWDNIIDERGDNAEIMIDDYLRNYSADIISKVSFGSSFDQGKEIFSKIRQLQKALSNSIILVGIPGIRYLPTKKNREIWGLNNQINQLILNITKQHTNESSISSPYNFLHAIIEGSVVGTALKVSSEQFIIDNCKNIYFAGHETTSVTASWCLMLLAVHKEWQDRVRAEILEVFSAKLPNFDMLRKLKTLNMVIQETLRLYPPATFVTRETLKDMKIGKLNVPRGTTIRVPIPTVHRDPDTWGTDADSFDPNRFANGISGACKSPLMYMPFGLGLRTCLGQNFALNELKIVLSVILSKFEFEMSSKYLHLPAFRLTLVPEHGVILKMRRF